MTPPAPGRRVRGSSTGRPIMALLDLLGRRMTLRILWELRGEPLTFRALQEAAATNPSVLNLRLKELREARLVEHGSEGYGLDQPGQVPAREVPAAQCLGDRMGEDIGDHAQTGAAATVDWVERPRSPNTIAREGLIVLGRRFA